MDEFIVRFKGQPRRCPSRDNRRRKLYTAERLALPQGGGRIGSGSIAEVETYVDKVMGSPAWARVLAAFGIPPGYCDRIAVQDGRGCRRAKARGGMFGRSIILPRWARTRAVVIHELAHHAAGLPTNHNWPFAWAFLELVGGLMGAEAKRALRDAYRTTGVKWHPPRELTEAQRAALRSRARENLQAARPRPEPDDGEAPPELARLLRF